MKAAAIVFRRAFLRQHILWIGRHFFSCKRTVALGHFVIEIASVASKPEFSILQ